ncbi:MAG: hypothetical protein L0219_08145, partial [Phycisphaerales bacterium]|nr:hypothetical protein [Phycisphaerales bacterium]
MKRAELCSLVHPAAQQHVHPAVDGIQRCTQLMRDDREEFVFHLVCRFRLPARGLLANEQLCAFGFSALALDSEGNHTGNVFDHP